MAEIELGVGLNKEGLVKDRLDVTDRNLEWLLSLWSEWLKNMRRKSVEEQVYGQYAVFNFGRVSMS